MTGELHQDTAHSVRDAAGRRWPAPDGIPFLRAGRADLAAEALARLDAGDRQGALVLLLADQDDWWRGPAADPAALHELVRGQDRLPLREAVTLLGWGPVGDYFLHRWSDPTFLAGLALTEAHWAAPRTAFELACGIGHHLRELARLGLAVTGVDVVFAKLWVARHWVLRDGGAARLLCLDAAQDWPALGRFDLMACHDAFYFLEPKPAILARLRGLLDPARGVLAVSHVHNSAWPNLSSGSAVTAAAMAGLFPTAAFYDDAELTRALVERRAPCPAAPEVLAAVEAFAVAEGPGLPPPRAVEGLLALPRPGAALRRNPLYGRDGRLAWPSERYAREYGPRATYPPVTAVPEHAVLGAASAEQARRRELLDLPERW
ncbi:class I SAM-dependent methyltransferase [Roseicella aquatilis]|uniref:Class I SAM-dependent methyltransferase n=1 Tax=Roseicella aquatilis TaxID=2527868 RepID=A0A4R4DRE1_9PROT|nr:class I SAM-dependent methyltransferase [Roseicella aquatilis]TCZ64942.1 class I SAM-dependent methyltransferase [Roseicella aquatilis]